MAGGPLILPVFLLWTSITYSNKKNDGEIELYLLTNTFCMLQFLLLHLIIFLFEKISYGFDGLDALLHPWVMVYSIVSFFLVTSICLFKYQKITTNYNSQKQLLKIAVIGAVLETILIIGLAKYFL